MLRQFSAACLVCTDILPACFLRSLEFYAHPIAFWNQLGILLKTSSNGDYHGHTSENHGTMDPELVQRLLAVTLLLSSCGKCFNENQRILLLKGYAILFWYIKNGLWVALQKTYFFLSATTLFPEFFPEKKMPQCFSFSSSPLLPKQINMHRGEDL